MQPDITVLTEHGLNPSLINLLTLNDFRMAANFCRSNYKAGGVVILVKTNIKHLELKWVSELAVEKVFEVSAIVFYTANKKILILGIYRSPSGDLNLFFNLLTSLLDALLSKFSFLVIMGDINIDILKETWSSRRLMDLMSSFDLFSCVKNPTRVQGNSATAIDVVFTNLPTDVFRVNVVHTNISDHYAQKMTILDGHLTKREVRKEYRDVSMSNLEVLKKLLTRENWAEVLNLKGTEEMFNKFLEIVKYYLNIACPMRILQGIKPKSVVNKWITKGILVSRGRLLTYGEKYKTSNDVNFKDFYKKYKATYKKVIRAAKAMAINQELKEAHNISKTAWKIINKERGKPEKINDISLQVQDKIITDPRAICDYLNGFFISSLDKILGSREDIKGKVSLEKNYYESVADSCMLFPTNANEVGEVIYNLKNKKSADIDGFSNFIIKYCNTELMFPLSVIINRSFQEGIFPSAMKISKIVPVYKKNDPKMAENYRPIVILSPFSKIFEKIYISRVMSFLDKHNILNSRQFGFRNGFSIDLAIAKFLDLIYKGIDEGNFGMGVMLDLTRAFECVDHSILLDKLYNWGIRGMTSSWLSSYLMDREQMVSYCNHSSDSIRVNRGVPQGSVLGPVLFILYVNDMARIFEKTVEMVMFADDTSLGCVGNKIEVESEINNALANVMKYCNSNDLVINESKSNVIVFNTRQKMTNIEPIIKIGDKPLEIVERVKFLGIIINSNLKWSGHIDLVCGRLAPTLFILKKMSHYCNLGMLKKVYFALFLSQLSYGVIFWGCADRYLTLRVMRMQKRAVRYMLKLGYRGSCRGAFRQLQILTFPGIYIYNVVKFARMINDFADSSHGHDLRRGFVFKHEQHRLTLYENKPAYAGSMLFNHLPIEIRKINNDKLFNKKLIEFLINGVYYSVDEFLASKT